MSTQEVATATTETPETEWSRFTDANLAEVFGDTPEPETPSAETAPTPPEVQTGQTPAEPVVDEDLQALDAILAKETPAEPQKVEVAEAPKPKAPETQETPRRQQLASYAETIDDALTRGDMDTVEAQFHPKAWEAITEHVLQKAIEKESGVKPDPKLAVLERRLAAAEAMLSDRERRELHSSQQQEQARQMAERNQRFGEAWNELFTAVKVTDPDQQLFLKGAVMSKLAENPQLAAHVRDGKFGDIGKVFREVYPKWKDMRKGAVAVTTEIRNTQEAKTAGKLQSTSTPAPQETAPDFDSEGSRTSGFWKKGLAALGFDK